MNKDNHKSLMEDFSLNNINPIFTKFIKFITISSNLFALFIANLFFYLLFKKEFPTMGIQELIIMYMISLFLLRLSLVFRILNFKNYIDFLKKIEFKKVKSVEESFETLFIDLKKLKLLIWFANGVKNLIFNIIKNLFPVLFLWIFFLFYLIIKWFKDFSNVDSTFIGIITMFGLLISLIQFYFKDIEVQKNSNLNLIITEINKEINSKLNHLSIIDFIEDEQEKNKKKYSLIKNKIVQTVSRIEERKNDGDVPKGSFRLLRYNIINSYTDPKIFFYILEEKILCDDNRKNLIIDLNTLYEDFLEKVKNEIVVIFKENQSITNELAINYILKNNSEANIDTIEHYFSSDKEGLNEDELYSYENRKSDLYLEVLMTVMLSSLVIKINVAEELKKGEKIYNKYESNEKKKYLIKSSKILINLISNWFEVKYNLNFEDIKEKNISNEDSKLFKNIIGLINTKKENSKQLFKINKTIYDLLKNKKLK